MLLERNGKLTMCKSKSSRSSYSLVESLPPLSMMNGRSRQSTRWSDLLAFSTVAGIDISL